MKDGKMAFGIIKAMLTVEQRAPQSGVNIFLSSFFIFYKEDRDTSVSEVLLKCYFKTVLKILISLRFPFRCKLMA